MNHERLSLRLERVASYITKGSVLADIGSDHAYLPCYAVEQGFCEQAIAGEVVEGPYQSALKQVKETGLADRIEVRKGNGLEVLEEDEATCITIAGMGGTLISDILERGKSKLGRADRLVLQPNVGERAVRSWLIDNGWELIAEEILEEDKKIYEVLVAEKGNPLTPYEGNKERKLTFGPWLLEQKSPVFKKKWSLERQHLLKVIEQLEKAERQGEQLKEKRQELLERISEIEEVLD
ncbi:tRNA (adenine(22)-N(1))-methyltransferase [Bacillus massiliglaciei]|uniref:tRNA (adenine(22)-N(1))-methyltransferase n=1 Tax=Bacillus massiliglaciei TaxID=1816693 RepID=UPI000A6B6496|nr:tRNA (adenine(22)-N(1))-methyltransferase TrmK [Bacillus massiliglaciei]